MFVVFVVGLTACGGDDSDDSAADDGPTKQPSGEPIRIGFVNLEGGVVSLPEIRVGAEVAMEHINGDLGGVQDRPFELARCDVDLTAEKSIDCANQLVEADVDLVMLGIDIGIDAALPIYEAAGIPVVGEAPFTPTTLRTQAATFLGASFYATAAAPLKYYADSGAESVTYLLGESPLARDIVDNAVEPLADELGIEYHTVFYDQAAPDWSVIAASAMADDPDVIGSPTATDTDCVGFIGALRSAGYSGEVLAGQCLAYVEELGSQATGALTTTYRWLPSDIEAAPEDKQADLDTYIEEMEQAGEADLVQSFGAGSFAIAMDLRSILQSIQGPIDAASIRDAITKVVDQPSFMGGPITCDGSVVPGQSVCSTGVLMYQVDEAGELKLASGDFVDLGDVVGT